MSLYIINIHQCVLLIGQKISADVQHDYYCNNLVAFTTIFLAYFQYIERNIK